MQVNILSMFSCKKIQALDDFFVELKNRREKGVYFYRINGYSENIRDFAERYYEAARLSGVVIEGRIPNPDEKNLSYYGEIMGMDFRMDRNFIMASLRKWLPRMDAYQTEAVTDAMYDILDDMRRGGKNENMLRNAYIKFMCWLYYKFERIINQMGAEKIPKILYEGSVSNYELKLLTLLSKAGCDIILLQYQGDGAYLKLDPASALSVAYQEPGMMPFPEGFSIRSLRQAMQEKVRLSRLYGAQPSVAPCTNAWITGKGLSDGLTDVRQRGQDERFFYNCFIRIRGVEDKLTYINDLFQFQLQIKNSGRKIVIADHQIPAPDMDEISSIRRGNYRDKEQMLQELSRNIQYGSNPELERLMVKAFLDILLEESRKDPENLNRLMNKAVYLLCWLKRYQQQLFVRWKMPDVACFIYLGGCRNDNEALFLKMLIRLPVDVFILLPGANEQCCLEDKLLYEIRCADHMTVERYPTENTEIRVGTAAYHAERELDSLMYQDSGMYRNMQYGKAVSISLQTMYEEIAILWDEELKYRPNFGVVDGIVNMPVIFAKVSGVKDGDVRAYWEGVKKLITPDTLVVKNGSLLDRSSANPIQPFATQFIKNRKLSRDKIKNHKAYQYGMLREEVQDYILDKLQILLDQKSIKGIFENGMEYTAIATVLNLPKDIIRSIQKFDFTRKNPKLIYINTTEAMMSLEDSIIVAFLNLIGYDILFFIPTGYQSVERYFPQKMIEEHQAGEYMYDLQIPDFQSFSANLRHSWRDIIFRRGS